MKSKQTEAGERQSSGKSNDKRNPTSIPSHQLKRIADEILDRSKELGLFDEMRMKLLAEIESSKEFNRVESGFKRELDSFCSQLDLSLPRSKLRERLNTRNLHRSASRLSEHVLQVSRQHRHELRKLYNEHALPFIRTLASSQSQSQEPQQSAAAAATATSNPELRLEVAPLSAASSVADSGFGSRSSISPQALPLLATPAPEAKNRSDRDAPEAETHKLKAERFERCERSSLSWRNHERARKKRKKCARQRKRTQVATDGVRRHCDRRPREQNQRVARPRTPPPRARSPSATPTRSESASARLAAR